MTPSALPRRFFLGMPLALAACGLAERPYTEQRQWPLVVNRPSTLPTPSRGLILEIRTIRAAPGLEARGLQTLQPDGSLQTSYYEQWAVPPAQGVEQALRNWMGQSGLFAGIVAPGSRINPDISIEGELNQLWVNAGAHTAQCGVALTAIDVRTSTQRILLQQTMTSSRPCPDLAAPAMVQAELQALSDVLSQIEQALAVAPAERFRPPASQP